MSKFYLSSTFRDLEECRKKVAETLRQLGHTVIGMEDYTADGRPPLKKVLADIAECDAYLGIFAWRYGYIPREDNPRKLAITELEYREALRLKKEPLIFILKEDAPWPGDQIAQDDKERKQIKALRHELSQRHVVGFFRDANELTTKVSVAVSRVGRGQVDLRAEPIHVAPTPPGPTRRSWRWYVAAAVTMLVLILLSYGLKIAYQSRRSEPPPERLNQWDARFTKKLDDQWVFPRGVWDTEDGEATRADKDAQALLVKGSEMGIPNDLGDEAFYNFSAVFTIHFKEGIGAAWVLRAQPDRKSGYLFEIDKRGASLFLTGWIYDGGQKRKKLREELLPFVCCGSGQGLLVEVTVKDNKFDYQITFQDETNDDPKSQAGEFVYCTFQVGASDYHWKWGTFGFLGNENGSVTKVESLSIRPVPRQP